MTILVERPLLAFTSPEPRRPRPLQRGLPTSPLVRENLFEEVAACASGDVFAMEYQIYSTEFVREPNSLSPSPLLVKISSPSSFIPIISSADFLGCFYLYLYAIKYGAFEEGLEVLCIAAFHFKMRRALVDSNPSNANSFTA